ncbi:MAG TPA: hypothetical protein K8W04_09490 [Bacteroides reticulotermitis]|nr:hypothetical protein [Bacteroides reticulotermitis]
MYYCEWGAIYTGLVEQPTKVDRPANLGWLIGQRSSAAKPTWVGHVTCRRTKA